MANIDGYSAPGLANQRLNDLLELLSQQGINQAQVSARTGIPTQYLSDIKHQRRPMTELVARRIGGEFNINYQWLMGVSTSMEIPKAPSAALPHSSTLWLPMFPHPIEGEPRANPKWDGSGIEIAGAAAAKLVLATHPYVLRFGNDDKQNRLRRGDLILISQMPYDNAEISIVRNRNQSFLARPGKDGTWIRVSNDTSYTTCTIIGHCIGIVWSSLYKIDPT